MTVNWARRWLLAVAALSVVGLVSTAFAAGQTLTSQNLGADTRVAPTFYPTATSSVSVTYGCGFLNLDACGDGQVNNSDRLLVTFNSRVKQSTICSAWTTDDVRTNISTQVTINNNVGATGNDTVTIAAVSGGCTAGFNFGSWDLGSAGYVLASSAYATSTFALADPTGTPDITITLGGGPANPTHPVVAAGTAGYFSCHTALQAATNAPCGTNQSRTTETELM